MRRKPFTWYKFFPAAFSEWLGKPDAAAGRRFKEMLLRLIASEAPDGTPEADMVADAERFSEKQKERVAKRWNRPPEAPETPPGDPGIDAAYDFAAMNGIDPDTAREWHEWQRSKGFESLRNWKSALKAFARKKRY